ncbi:hypothetical protein H5410_060874 [Solanum commersonii]|uniref:FCP1 homology domain-containing protein n=1 Tax=Solanum commersonii TaxID=4109 RepID=A0A9J5W7B1_SOLCO|nr:hypothetical protein H5410_060874 [Solanum commersonii]
MYPRPWVLITYCRKRKNFISFSTSVPDIIEDVVIEESKTKTTNADTTLPHECTIFTSETRSRQISSWERGEYDESHTLLLDDSPHKALSNLVSINPFFVVGKLSP